MIYNVGGNSQNRLLARVFIQRRQRRQFTLAQRCHIVTLVDRAVQEDGVSFNCAADNLQVSAQSIHRWRAYLQDTTNPQGRDDATHNHRGPAGFLDDIQEELIAFVSEWRDRGMPVTRYALVRKIGHLKPEFLLKSSAARI